MAEPVHYKCNVYALTMKKQHQSNSSLLLLGVHIVTTIYPLLCERHYGFMIAWAWICTAAASWKIKSKEKCAFQCACARETF